MVESRQCTWFKDEGSGFFRKSKNSHRGSWFSFTSGCYCSLLIVPRLRFSTLLRSFYRSLVSCLMLRIRGEPQLPFAETNTLFSRNMLSAEVPEKLVSAACRHVCVKRRQMDWKSRTKQRIKRTENQMDVYIFFHKFDLFHVSARRNTSAIMKKTSIKRRQIFTGQWGREASTRTRSCSQHTRTQKKHIDFLW